MSKLTIVAIINAKPDQVEFVKAELLKLIEPTRAEAGCINYDLHQDNDQPTHFLYYENWETRELWQEHSNSQHLQDFQAATADAIADFSVHEMTQIG